MHPTSECDVCCHLNTRKFYLDSKRLYCRTPEKWFGGEFSVQWFGFRPENQSSRPKVGVTDQKSEIQPGRPPESEPNRPKKGPEWGLGEWGLRASTEPPLKAFLIPPKENCLLNECEQEGDREKWWNTSSVVYSKERCQNQQSYSICSSSQSCIKIDDDHSGNHAIHEKAGNRDEDMLLPCHLAGKERHDEATHESLGGTNANSQGQRQDLSNFKRARDGLAHLIDDGRCWKDHH